jgi:hypothetical protein
MTLAQAIAASSSNPTSFHPLQIPYDGVVGGTKITPQYAVVTDGGIYDNLGIISHFSSLFFTKAKGMDVILLPCSKTNVAVFEAVDVSGSETQKYTKSSKGNPHQFVFVSDGVCFYLYFIVFFS